MWTLQGVKRMITERFLTLFKAFLEKYKYYGEPRFYHRNKEQNFSKMYGHLSELLELITKNQKMFDDVNIIEHLNKTILAAAKTNAYLLQCWVEFYTNYHKENNNNNSPVSVPIQIDSDGAHSEQLTLELQLALSQSMQTAEEIEKKHNAEIALLKKQLESLKDENAALVLENKNLKEQMVEKGVLESVHQQLANAQKEFSSLAKMMDSLHEMTMIKPKIDSIDTKEISTSSIESSNEVKPAMKTNTDNNDETSIISLSANKPKPKAPPRIARAGDYKSSSSLNDKKDSPKVAVKPTPRKEKEAPTIDFKSQMEAELNKKLEAIRNATKPQEQNITESTTPDSW